MQGVHQRKRSTSMLRAARSETPRHALFEQQGGGVGTGQGAAYILELDNLLSGQLKSALMTCSNLRNTAVRAGLPQGVRHHANYVQCLRRSMLQSHPRR